MNAWQKFKASKLGSKIVTTTEGAVEYFVVTAGTAYTAQITGAIGDAGFDWAAVGTSAAIGGLAAASKYVHGVFSSVNLPPITPGS